MNKFKTDINGGMPIRLDDFRFIIESINESFRGAFANYTTFTAADSFIISGCNITGSTYSDGWLYFKGEILPCVGGTIPSPGAGQINYWSVSEVADTAGSRVFQNGTTYDVYFTRRAVIVAGVAPSDYLPIDSSTFTTPRLNGLIASRLDSLRFFARIAQESWRSVGSAGQPAFGFGFSNYSTLGGPLEFRKNEFGEVTVRGAVQSTSAVGLLTTIFTLPAGYVPSRNLIVPVMLYDITGNTRDTLYLDIITNGRLRAAYTLNNSTTTNWATCFEIKFQA
jgi:hypothetical protein